LWARKVSGAFEKRAPGAGERSETQERRWSVSRLVWGTARER